METALAVMWAFHKVASDNNIFLLGYYKLLRVNSNEQTVEMIADGIPGSYPIDEIVSLDLLPNGSLVYLSRSTTNQMLHSYSPNGEHQWSRTYNTPGAIYLGTGSKNLLVMPDGSILFPMHHGTVAYLVKTDPEGIVVPNDDPVVPIPMASIIAYPQPAHSKVMISVMSEQVGDVSYSIYNIRGQKLYSARINGQHKEQSFELPNDIFERIPNGIYLISLENGDSRIATTKLVVVK